MISCVWILVSIQSAWKCRKWAVSTQNDDDITHNLSFTMRKMTEFISHLQMKVRIFGNELKEMKWNRSFRSSFCTPWSSFQRCKNVKIRLILFAHSGLHHSESIYLELIQSQHSQISFSKAFSSCFMHHQKELNFSLPFSKMFSSHLFEYHSKSSPPPKENNQIFFLLLLQRIISINEKNFLSGKIQFFRQIFAYERWWN